MTVCWDTAKTYMNSEGQAREGSDEVYGGEEGIIPGKYHADRVDRDLGCSASSSDDLILWQSE